MRRIFYAVPVAVLGAGGFYWWHHGARGPAPQARQGLRMRDGRTYLPPVPGSAPGPTIVTGSPGAPASGPVTPSAPSAAPGTGTTPSPAVTASASSPSIGAPSEPTASRPPPLTQVERFSEQNSPTGEARKLAVPVPGVDKARKKMGAVAACQGPQAQQHYATLTGNARTEFARICARQGVTLPP